MNPIVSLHGARALARLLAMLLLGLALGGCGTALQKVVREDAAAPGGYVVADASDAAGRVRVMRGAQEIPLRLPLMLKPGDVIETDAGTGAVLRLDQGEAVIGPRTRVRIGSLEVIFGRIFASVRGLFRAEDGNLAADVEGTRFAFESAGGGATRVVVFDGTVRCSPKAAAWAPVRVRAGSTLNAMRSAPPSVTATAPAERDEILRWTEAITNAPRAGYCCAGGQVYPALSNACRGHFESSEREARQQCARGWCCDDGEVGERIRAECGGSFHGDRAAAERACAAPGWCCANGQLTQETRQRCRGKYFDDRRVAEKACAPAPLPSGWCCIDDTRGAYGKVWPTNRDDCIQHQGHFHTDRGSAERQCGGTQIR